GDLAPLVFGQGTVKAARHCHFEPILREISCWRNRDFSSQRPLVEMTTDFDRPLLFGRRDGFEVK
ncbi:MAG: hypothetical protein KGJ80_13100, partial [Chloroflexota bacterium]|nr:hypothetical protein [Chloroflexota bacterium]